MKKAVCIHGHFYQPPRENPWLGRVEVQDSAHPFHDWNERINVECYAPNGAARLVDGDGRILHIVNNYAHMSFNFGPTLLAWMENHARDELDRIVEGDRQSRQRQDGHGNALAMPYNHLIMPLAGARDQETQVLWGLHEFERHFGRRPEGMWLPETAVNLDTLDLLARHGIQFTILSPYQARRIRPKDAKDKKKWEDVPNGRIEPRRAYLCRLREGRSIALFFYDRHIAHDLAFGPLLNSGDQFAQRLQGGFDGERPDGQLVHVATDGESYGHHRTHGDMALAFALAKIEDDPEIDLTNYARFLAAHPPEYEVEIVENSSWSCAHGLERWRSDCGCKLDPGRDWNQRWRTALRDALDWLREQIDPFFEKRAGALVKDPWAARNAYIAVLADRSAERLGAFCADHQRKSLGPAAVVELLKLLEMERHGMLIYTSCGWFFDDISGLEAVQNLKYACRTVQLARDVGLDVEEPFLERLARAESNVREKKNGAEIYKTSVRPAVADLRRVAAHAAIEAAFRDHLEAKRLGCYEIDPRFFQRDRAGFTSMSVGRVETRSRLTQETEDWTFAVLTLGGHEVHCSLQATHEVEDLGELKNELLTTYESASLTDVIRMLDRHFGNRYYTLKDVFLEARRQILAGVTSEKMEQYEGVYRTLFEENLRLMEFVRDADAPIPKSFLVAAEYVLNEDLEEAIHDLIEDGRTERLGEVLAQARRWQVPLRLAEMEPRLRDHLNRLLEGLAENPEASRARRAASFVRDVQGLGLPLFFWQAQNTFERLMEQHAPALNQDEAGGAKRETLGALRDLGEALGFLEGGWKPA